MALAYAKDRHAFGRPIGSYQAVKHQLVEILRRIDTLRSLCFYAGFAAEASPEELAAGDRAVRGSPPSEAADYATRTCIAVHGGIGATWEHDAPLFWRRAQLSRLLLGGERGAADRVAERGRSHGPRPATAAPRWPMPQSRHRDERKETVTDDNHHRSAQFNLDAIGQWSDPVEFEVERERIQAYAEATNDPIAAHRSGDLAPPVFAIVPAFGALGRGERHGDAPAS